MNSTNKRIIIHAGPGKTGSSAIQAWLSQHQEELSEKGIYYPSHSLSKNSISSGNLKKLLSRNDDGKWQVDSKKVEKLLQKFSARSESIMLLSSEFFFHNILQLHKLIPQAEFIVYVRNPVELLESNYNQGVKRHSVTRRFVAPASLDKFFWSHINNVFSKVPNAQLHLRAYHADLFIGGSIVNDLLSVFGVSFDVPNHTINPSFTFPVLEFKRLMNHFCLDDLEWQLDASLQGVDIGHKQYSLMPEADFTRLTKQNVSLMDEFIAKYKQTHLQPLRELLAKTEQKNSILHKDITFKQLEAVSILLRNRFKPFYQVLKERVTNNANLMVDNPLIFDVFAVEPKPVVLKDKVDETLLHHVKHFSLAPHKSGKVMYELAVYFSQAGDNTNALKFAQAACLLNKNNTVFISLLNRQLAYANNTFKHKLTTYSVQGVLRKLKTRLKHSTLGQKF